MNYKRDFAPHLEEDPEWYKLSERLEELSGRRGEWRYLRKVEATDDLKTIVPVLLECGRSTSSAWLRVYAARALNTALVRPWTGEVLRWLEVTESPTTEGALVECLQSVVNRGNAQEIWDVIKRMPELEGGADLLKKLYRFEALRGEVGGWMVDKIEQGKASGQLRKLAQKLGLVPAAPPKLSEKPGWEKRLARTKLVRERGQSSRGTGSVKEIWSTEVDLAFLLQAIEEIEARFSVQVMVGVDVQRRLKRAREEGLLIAVATNGGEESAMALYCCLEDADIVTLRLLGEG